MDTAKAVFLTLPKNFHLKAKNFWLLSDKDKNTCYFFQKNTLLPSFLVGTYISILAVLLEIFWQKTEKVRSIYENGELFSEKNPH